jgi:hypothetical protein
MVICSAGAFSSASKMTFAGRPRASAACRVNANTVSMVTTVPRCGMPLSWAAVVTRMRDRPAAAARTRSALSAVRWAIPTGAKMSWSLGLAWMVIVFSRGRSRRSRKSGSPLTGTCSMSSGVMPDRVKAAW